MVGDSQQLRSAMISTLLRGIMSIPNAMRKVTNNRSQAHRSAISPNTQTNKGEPWPAQKNRSKNAEQPPTFSDHVNASSDSIRRIKFPPTNRLWLKPAKKSPHAPEQLTSLLLRIRRLSRTHWITLFARYLEVRVHL